MKTSILLMLLLPTTVNAGELHLVVSGRAIHFNTDKKWNENNWGLGFEYDFEPLGNWIPLATGLSFKDSNNQTSNYLGAGIKRRYQFKTLHIGLGAFGFLMTRHDYKDNSPFVGALPFVSVGNEWGAVNIAYVPKLQPGQVSFMYFNVQFKLMEF